LKHDSFWGILGIIVFWGTAGGLAYPALSNLVVEAVPEGRTSEAIGVLVVVRTTAMAIGTQLIVMLLATTTVADPSKGPGIFPTSGAYDLTLGAITGVALLAVLVAFTIPRGRSTANAASLAAAQAH